MTNLDHLSTETLADYAEGLLRESEASAVEAHLDGCADCRAEESLLKSLSLILAADSPGPMPAIYAERIDRALAEVAMTDPLSGSFHPEGSAFQGAALDLTPSAFVAASSTGGDGPSADVVDLASRRRGVAQSLSRVTTVAASIVLLIGGTVLGLQAINSGEGPGTPDSVAGDPGKPIVRPTTRPAPRTAATAVPVDPKAKQNSDGSWTNPDGTVIRTDRSAVKPNGDVIPAPPPFKLGPGEDPAAPDMVDMNPDRPRTKSEGGVNTARGPAVGPIIPGTEPTTVPEAPPAPAPAPGPVVETPAAPAAADPGDEPVTAQRVQPETSPEPTADNPKAAPAGDATPAAASEPYFEQSNDTYDKDNFAKKVLTLLKKGNYQASSTGEASVDPNPNVDPAADPRLSESPAASPMYTPSSIKISMTSPTVGESAATADSVAARPTFKAKAKRCASVFQGDLLAADQGVWEGKVATIIVMSDPTDPNQVVGRVVSGGCKDRAAVETGLQHTQFVVTKT